jgi:hypothetical protein
MAEPLMQRTGRLPVHVECSASGSLIQNNSEPDPERKASPANAVLPEQAEQSMPRPLEQPSTSALTNASIIAARLRNFTEVNF